MTRSFRLPDLGEGIHEAEILAIPVTVGQVINEGDIILEIETDKAAVEIPSPFSGSVAAIAVAVGDTANVGDLLMSFTTGEQQPVQGPVPTPDSKTTPAADRPAKGRPVPASPSTRRLARELDIDLHDVNPTGSGGVVTRDDVQAFARQKQENDKKNATLNQERIPAPAGETTQTALPPASADDEFSRWGPIVRQPFRSIRRATAGRMSRSWAEIPHVHCEDTADITRLEEFRRKHKEDIEAAGGRLTMTIFAMKAAATALKTYPYFNASLDQQAREIILKHYFHIGIAVDSDRGLTVPVIRDVDRKSIKELAIETDSAISRARSGKLSREEMQGGSFTITNAGALGGSRFSAIINYPEVAILGLGQGRMEPKVIIDERDSQRIVPRLLMPIMLCFDHRVVDGGDAIRFLRLIIDGLEDPEELLITMI